ncbi:hypothetical protein EDB85DRAFT_1896593 [Lactarius pseudohatsudake]|nr:hypothetical protein EDB85DRAFT_1896593 [Lactarius pseudohatsudake]
MSEEGQRLNAAPLTEAEVHRLRAALPDSETASPRPLPERIEYRTEEEDAHTRDAALAGVDAYAGLEANRAAVEGGADVDDGNKENEDPATSGRIHRDAEGAVYEQPELELMEWYPAEHPDLLTTRDSDAPTETPYACNSLGRPLYRGDRGKAPVGYKANKADDFVHYLITDARGITRQAAYVQVVMAADPRVIALVDDSDKVYSKPLYAEPMVRERGKPHYAPEDLFMFAVGHAGRHRVDMAVNELRDVSAKAELHRFRSYTQEAERVEQRLHSLALALGEIKGELARSKFRLEMADLVARIEEKQQGWMGGVGPTRRRGRCS